MIIRKENMTPEVRVGMKDGGGQVTILQALKKEQHAPHNRMFSPMILEKGCGIGKHTHENEAEIYFVVQGEGIYNDNGNEYLFRQGDISITYSGEFHSIRNEKDEPMVVLACIVTEK